MSQGLLLASRVDLEEREIAAIEAIVTSGPEAAPKPQGWQRRWFAQGQAPEPKFKQGMERAAAEQ